MSYLTCEFCGKQDETVSEEYCGYSLEINDEEVLEVVCDSCEREHLDEV